MFIPLAMTVVMALLSSLVLSMTVVPVLAELLIRPHRESGEGRWLERLRDGYGRVLRWALGRSRTVVIGAVMILFLGGGLVPFLGREFLPTMLEGTIVVNLLRLPSISLEQSLKVTGDVERLLLEIPEVAEVVSRTGANELGTDPMGMELSDMYVVLKPRESWSVRTQEEIEERIRLRLAAMPGVTFGLSQPIAMRVDELVSGVRSAVAVKLFGDDLEVLQHKADEIAQALRRVRGVTDLRVEPLSGLYTLTVDMDRARLARYGINVSRITELIEAIGSGISAGELFEGQRRFPIVVRLPEERRTDVEAIKALWTAAPDGSRIPLRELAEVRIVEGPSQISREQASRRIVIEFNVEDRDLVGTVEEAQAAVTSEVHLPSGYYVTWGGQF
jgi:heavy metal efflux system protein